jgi:hypothetical protein
MIITIFGRPSPAGAKISPCATTSASILYVKLMRKYGHSSWALEAGFSIGAL